MTGCRWCANAAEFGWWGDGTVTHCHQCHATWGLATKTTHCVTCHETFSTPRNCDDHQKASRRDGRAFGCRPPAAVGLVATPNAHGTPVWHQPGGSERFSVSRQRRETEPSATHHAELRD